MLTLALSRSSAVSRAVVERGLRQRRTTAREFDEHRTIKALPARLERTTDLPAFPDTCK